MTRTVDATLHAALQAGTGKIIATGYLGYGDGTVSHSGPVSQFKITGTTLQFTWPYIASFAGDQTHIWLTRGLSIQGTDYTITTGRYAIRNQQYLPNKTQVIDGNIFPATYSASDGYKTYDQVITAFCTAMGKTAVYREPGEAWHAYRFLGLGQYMVLTDGMSILNLLQQKRLISLCDIGSEQVLVYCADVYGSTDLSVIVKDDFTIDHTLVRTRQFIWKDELNVYHQDGVATDPIHNLGYMESTDSPPARHTPTHQIHAALRPDLRIVDGDRVSFTAWGTTSSSLFARITEQMQADSRGVPQWRTILEANTVFDNTEGGAVPASVEKTAHYIPVNTSAFDNLLSSKDNNLQHALETLDDAGAWKTWTPSYSASGSMTYTGVTTAYARYCKIGKLVFFLIRASGTTGGTAGIGINFTLPLPVGAGLPTSNLCVATAIDAANTVARGSINGTGSSDSGVVVRQVAGVDANWGLGAGRQIIAQGFYETT